MRIGGIASGMDTEQLISDIMRAERVRLDRYNQDGQRIKWRQEAFHNINRDMANFILKSRKDLGLNKVASSGALVKSSSSSFDWVKKATSVNEGVVKATAKADAMSGTHTVKVKQLASVASLTSKDISGLMDADGNFLAGSYGPLTITTDAGSKTFTIGAAAGEIQTIDQLVSEINNATDSSGGTAVSLGIRAAYDKTLGKLMINTRTTGEQKNITMSNTLAGTFFDSLNAQGTDAILWFNESPDATQWSNASSIDPVTFDSSKAIKQSTNNFTLYGINLQLNNVQQQTDNAVSINVDTNVEGMVDKITAFVKDYNEMIGKVNSLTKEKIYRDYRPLSSEEKEAMKETDIELWEEKAKSGLLRNDESITRTLQNIRSGLYENVYTGGTATDRGTLIGVQNHLTHIGIATGSYQSGGKLEIDETKLREAISNNPEGVVDLLFATSDIAVPELSDNPTTAEIAARNLAVANKRANTGLFNRVYDDMINGMKDIVSRSGTGNDSDLYRDVQSTMLIDFVTSGGISKLDKDLLSLNERIINEERLLASREDRYWKQFTAMEKAMEKMNQQSGWLMAQLGQSG
ncbi:flagellar filament capping protein FliD [Alkaliphilus hydrothermalis]|uniref:Flagellar hook-associated protein 2 n=1 Tax=Alkaliphilus hydrothermalis TaxID=1482730 RepID=A0ABS2NS37_9FIRM|nr:flagellar filament capping protein FliD [Alkaliphilus hydrothermalis]MBM7615384.1 flagellar hook-associated protein 2 [Alkaliphilus hydrothermalis]